ncbi:MAG: ABC transporter substrate-binding protein [Rhodospirillales bacterium]|nr:ABC transporter substrate-binding protein [Rhodospirillales bacterium]
MLGRKLPDWVAARAGRLVVRHRGRPNRLTLRIVLVVGVWLALAGLAPQAAFGLDRVTFGTDWRAQAEHGGFYQTLALGFYEQAGLAVSIREGGPQINHSQLLAAGRLDFGLASNSFTALNFVREGIPMVAVAAVFQKDPAILMAHAGQGNDSFAALKGKPIMIGADTRAGSWQFLKSRFAYTDDQIRPYTFNLAPFLVDPQAIQQGYLGSEPFLAAGQGIKPVVLLLADAGYGSYGALIMTSQRLIDDRPDIVQRFVSASIKGWESYLHGDPAPGNDLIKQANPEMTEALLTYAIDTMKANGVVESGDAVANGIGAMSESRWRSFFEIMAGQGLYPQEMAWQRAFTLQFTGREPGRPAGR